MTRRCTQREFLLRPSALTNHIFKYVLALAATRFGIRLHAVCVMSNHFHIVLTDPHANLPEFARVLDCIVAKALNAVYNRQENFWAPSSYSAVELASPEDVIEKIAYALANPANADLVEHGHQWPGVWSHPRSIGRSGELIKRPKVYFVSDGFMPESVELAFSRPPGFASLESFQKLVNARIADLELAALGRRRSSGVQVLGVRQVLKQRHTDRPTTKEPPGGLNPRIAAGDRETRSEVLDQLVSFLERHREALIRYCSGKRATVFPYGTYLMRVRFGVACATS
jgi:REP element-mobilizing transposase RayT